MNILHIHNYYQQAGGEDKVFESEVALLQEHGHKVFTYMLRNEQIAKLSRAKLAATTIWSRQTSQKVRALIDLHKIELVHVHNTLPLVSPSVFSAAKKAGVAVVRTLHNYRHRCAAGTFFRDGHVCELCLNKTFAYPAIQHACYRESRTASSVAVLSQTTHNLLGTHNRHVDRYIALSDFTKEKAVQGGLTASKVAVKPNFLFEDSGIKTKPPAQCALFVGRLSPEKGVELMLNAFEATGSPLKIAGDGPLRELVETVSKRCDSIQYLGKKMHTDLIEEVKAAAFLVVPSIWYETFGLVAIEAYACGTPVVASRIGSLETIIEDRVTGLHFKPSDQADLVEKINWAFSNPEAMQEMGVNARGIFESRYTAQANYESLIQIYGDAIEHSKQVGN